MRIVLFFSIAITGLSLQAFGMQALFHLVDKNYIDPVNYITEAKSSELCQKLLLLSSSETSTNQFELDQNWWDIIHQVFERQEKTLHVVEEAICLKDSHTPIEQILRAAHSGLYSPNALAIIHGYLNTKIKISEETAAKLKMAQEAERSNPFAHELKPITPSPYTVVNDSSYSDLQGHDLSPSSLEQLILESNPSWTMKFANLIRKSITNPSGYLTDSKAATVSEAVLFFHPLHHAHKEFNRSIPLHQALVHHAFEREIRLLTHVEYALKNNQHDTIVTLQQNVSPGYFSNILKSVMSAYIKYIARKKSIDAQVRQKNAVDALNTKKNKDEKTGRDASKPCSCTPPKNINECITCMGANNLSAPQPPVPKNPSLHLEKG